MRLYSKTLFLLLVFIVLSFTIDSCKSEDDEEEEERPRSCQKYIFDFIMGILNSTLKCLSGQATFKPNSIFEYITRSSCLLKCVLQEEGIIGEDGTLDDIGAAFYFEETFSEEVRAISLPIAQGCFAYANEFVTNEYWCKSYLKFIECSFGAILKGLIPYGGDCVTYPLLGILFSTLKYLSPDSPKVTEEMEELRRSVSNRTQIKCFDKDCSKMYEYKKVNGTQSVVMYNKDMEIISVDNRKTKPKPKNDVKNDAKNTLYQNNNNLNSYAYR